jgi:hypothetical protein
VYLMIDIYHLHLYSILSRPGTSLVEENGTRMDAPLLYLIPREGLQSCMRGLYEFWTLNAVARGLSVFMVSFAD